MPSSPYSSTSTVGSYELLGLRVQEIVSSYTAQKTQSAIVTKAPSELDEDWNQLLSDLVETDGVKVAVTETGAAKITWQNLSE